MFQTKFYFLILSFLITSLVFGQVGLLDSKALKEDFEMAATISSQLSPGLNKQERKRIKKQINEISSSYKDKKMDAIAFLKSLVDAGIDYGTDEHGHYTLPTAVMMDRLSGTILFPIPIKIINQRLYVNIEHKDIPFGAEILRINQYSAEEILKTLTKNRLEDSYELRSIEANFDILFAIFLSSSRMYEVEFKPKDANFQPKTVINGIALEERDAIYKNRVYPLHSERQNNLMYYDFIDSLSLFYFQLNSFQINDRIYSNEEHYAAFKFKLDSVFQLIRDHKAKHLIIDLRYNHGGDAFIPPLLYSYIALSVFPEELRLETPNLDLPFRSNIQSLAGRPTQGSNVIDDYLKKLTDSFEKNSLGRYQALLQDTIRNPQKEAYTAKVYLLVGGRTVSSAAYFTALFKSENRGLIFGERLGGSHKKMTAGQMVEYQLPNSKIIITIPLMRIFFSEKIRTEVPEAFIIPKALLSEQEILKAFHQKQDYDVEAVLKYIKS